MPVIYVIHPRSRTGFRTLQFPDMEYPGVLIGPLKDVGYGTLARQRLANIPGPHSAILPHDTVKVSSRIPGIVNVQQRLEPHPKIDTAVIKAINQLSRDAKSVG